MPTPAESPALRIKLAALPPTVWDDRPVSGGDPPPWREIAELLCGALWHFDLAEQIGPFSPVKMSTLLGGTPVPWAAWLEQGNTVTLPPKEGGPWTISMPTDPRFTSFAQSALLGSVALRLAGAWQILYEGKNPPPRSKQQPKSWAKSLKDPMLDDPEKILDNSGNFNSPHPLHITQQVLIVVAFRDSFMHGETPTGGGPIWQHRKRWRNSNDYNLETIAQACIGVWEALLTIVKRESSPASLPST
jgi:hypothetical protein